MYDRDGGQLVTASFMDYAMPRRGIDHVDMPLTPLRIWQLLNS